MSWRARDFGLLALGCTFGAGAMALMGGVSAPPSRPDHVYYANCREAFFDGARSIRRGEPGYRRPLDADNDGIACEPYRGP